MEGAVSPIGSRRSVWFCLWRWLSGKRVTSRGVWTISFMPQKFIACDRAQSMLMPQDLLDWVPDDHVVWSILGAVDQMDLSSFYAAYPDNGQGAGGV